MSSLNEIFHKKTVIPSLLNDCYHFVAAIVFNVIDVVGWKQFYIGRSRKSELLFLIAREQKA